MRAKAFNPQVFLEFLCYCVFGGLLLYLVCSGKYLSYVTPRMKPYLYFAAIIMGIWALSGLGRLFRPQHKIRSAHCFVLAIPILLLLLPHNPLSASDFAGNYLNGNTFAGQSIQSSYGVSQKQAPSGDSGAGTAAGTSTSAVADENDPPSEETAPTDSAGTAVSDTQPDVSGEASSADLPGLDVANKTITVTNEGFSFWLTEIGTNTEHYEGYKVIITGFVCKDPEYMKSDEFLPARLMMTCCAADLVPAGLLCQYDKASELKEDSWVTVEGTLFTGQYEYEGHAYDNPELAVTQITPAEEVEGYVYPYY